MGIREGDIIVYVNGWLITVMDKPQAKYKYKNKYRYKYIPDAALVCHTHTSVASGRETSLYMSMGGLSLLWTNHRHVDKIQIRIQIQIQNTNTNTSTKHPGGRHHCICQ